jgi:hypothetical protein
MEIVKVHIRKDGVKYLIVPKNSKIKSGDFVAMTNDLNLVSKFKMEVKNDGKRKD